MPTVAHINRWLVGTSSSSSPSALALLIFGHAGSCAGTYYNWATALEHADRIFVQLPGRATRYGEPLCDDLLSAAGNIAASLQDLGNRRLIMFGHSLGAALAYQTSLYCLQLGIRNIERLIVSARRAPHVSPKSPAVHALPEQEFWEHMREYGETFQAVYDNDELRGLFSPIIRADLRMNSRFLSSDNASLPVPITAFCGAADPFCTSPDMAAWTRCTTGAFRHHSFPGGHFYLFEHQDATVRALQAVIDRHRASLSPHHGAAVNLNGQRDLLEPSRAPDRHEGQPLQPPGIGFQLRSTSGP